MLSNLDIFTFKSHNSKLKGVITAQLHDDLFNDNLKSFVTWDDNSLQQWDFNSTNSKVVVNQKFRYPNHQQNVSQNICAVFY